MREFTKIVVSILIAGALVLLGYFALKGIDAAWDRSEIGECEKWNHEAGEYPGYYVVQWQVDQCKAHGIELVAPLKTKE